MSNVPHKYTTPQEDIKHGKIGVVLWSIHLAIMVFIAIYFLFSDWVMSLIVLAFLFIPILGIRVGKESIERGKKREREGTL